MSEDKKTNKGLLTVAIALIIALICFFGKLILKYFGGE